MTHLHIDAGSGLAGDMLLCGLLDLADDTVELESLLSAVPVSFPKIEVEEVARGGLRALHLKVGACEGHGHGAAGAHEGHHHHGHGHGHGPARALPEMLELLDRSDLSAAVAERCCAVFTRLAEAEAAVHGKPLNEVHFHEVSGIDTIIDVIGVSLLLERLAVRTVSCSPVTVGSGFVDCAHGRLPVPAPATAELLRGIPVRQEDTGVEMTTPTGAALAAALAGTFGPAPEMRVERIGYGAGTRDLPGRSNVVRLFLGTAAEARAGRDRVCELVCLIDDMSGEEVARAADRLRECGALDVYTIAAAGKMGRPAVEMTVLCPLPDVETMAAWVLAETSSFGVRRREVERSILPREWIGVQVGNAPVRVKVGCLGGGAYRFAAEYEDAAAVADACGCSLRQIMAQAEMQAREEFMQRERGSPQETGKERS